MHGDIKPSQTLLETSNIDVNLSHSWTSCTLLSNTITLESPMKLIMVHFQVLDFPLLQIAFRQ